MQNFSVDISTSRIPATIYVKQGDSFSRFFALTIADNGAPWEAPEDAVYTIRFKTALSSGWYDTIQLPGGGTRPAVVTAGNVLTCEVAEQATLGNGQLCVMVNDSTGFQLGTWNLNIVAEIVPGADSPEAEHYYGILAGQIAQVAKDAAAAAASAAAAEKSAEDAQQSALVAKGHTIMAEDGSAMEQRAALQFVGFNVADDPSGKTVVSTKTAGDTKNVAGYVGEVVFFADEQLRENFVWADGSAIDPAKWPDLAAYAATAGWRTDDGTGWYRTPDMRSRFLLPKGGDLTINDIGGEKNHLLTVEEMPKHTHTTSIVYRTMYMSADEGQNRKSGDLITESGTGTKSYTTASTRGGKVHNNMPPYYVVTAQIRAKVDEIAAKVVEINGNTLGGFTNGQVLTQQNGKMVGQTMAYAELWSNKNAHDFKGGQFYRLAYGFNITNAPATSGVILEYLPYTVGQSYCAQRCTAVQSSGGLYRTWTRTYDNTLGWSKWCELVTAYKAGDKYTISNFTTAARASSSGADSVTVCVPIQKPSEAKSITAEGTITVRGTDGAGLATAAAFSVEGVVEEGFLRFSPELSYSQKPASYAVVSIFLQNVTITFK